MYFPLKNFITNRRKISDYSEKKIIKKQWCQQRNYWFFFVNKQKSRKWTLQKTVDMFQMIDTVMLQDYKRY